MNRKNGLFKVCGLLLILFLFPVAVSGADNPVIAKNIEFVNADLRDVFRGLAEAGKFNVILDSAVYGEVTLTLKYGVTLKDAINIIAKTYGYNCRWLADSPTVVIGNSKFINGNFDRRISKVFQLKYADPVIVAEALEVVVPKNRLQPNPATNQISVMASDVEIQNMAEIIAKLDRETTMVNLETRVEEVSDQFWKEIGVDNIFSPPHMGIYLLNAQQLKAMEENPKINLLAKPNLSSLENHQSRIFIGDKIPLVTEKNKQGDINYKVEYIDAGTSLAVTPRINTDNKLTVKVNITVSTVANKSQPGGPWVPWVVTRDFESTIRLEAGQAFILSGLLQRNEFTMMKASPYDFPVLNDLFAKESTSDQSGPVSHTEVIILVIPKILGAETGQTASETALPAEAGSTGREQPITTTGQVFPSLPDERNPSGAGENNSSNQQIVVGLENKPPIDEEKPEVKITGPSQTGLSQAENLPPSYREITYKVKKGDSLTSIGHKFGVDLGVIVERNKLGKTGTIKPNTVLIIPVPRDRVYVLKPKETLWRIAKRYGTTLAVLKELNGISDETKVNAGQEIVLPVPAAKIINPQF